MICCSCKTELSPEKFSSNCAVPKIIMPKPPRVRLHKFEPTLAIVMLNQTVFLPGGHFSAGLLQPETPPVSTHIHLYS